MNQPTTAAWNEASGLVDLLARFPYMFPLGGSERRRAYVFFRGWMPTFMLMCEQIDAQLGEDKRSFAWTRVREKFGAPSLSYDMRGRARHAIYAHRPCEVRLIVCEPIESFEPVAIEIQELVLRAELALRESCIVCGAHSTITNAAGPWASLCTKHRSSAYLEDLAAKDASVWSAAQLRMD